MNTPERTISLAGLRLRAFREQHGWNMTEMARRSGVAKSALCMIETGRVSGISMQMVTRMSASLGITPQDLMGYAMPGAPPPLSRSEMERLLKERAGVLHQSNRQYLIGAERLNSNMLIHKVKDDVAVRFTARRLPGRRP